jgi:hypothetical protein
MNFDKMKIFLLFVSALLSDLALLHAADLTGISEADGTVKLNNNYTIKPLSSQEEIRIKIAHVLLRRLLETYGTKQLFCVSNKPGQTDVTIVLTINGKGVKDITTIEEEIAKAREAKVPLMLQVTSRMAGGGGSQIGPSPAELILDAAAGILAAPATSPTTLNDSSVPSVEPGGERTPAKSGPGIDISPENKTPASKSAQNVLLEGRNDELSKGGLSLSDILLQAKELPIRENGTDATTDINYGLPQKSWGMKRVMPNYSSFWKSAFMPGIGAYYFSGKTADDGFFLKQAGQHNSIKSKWVGVLPEKYVSTLNTIGYPFINLKCAGISEASPGWSFTSEGSGESENYPSHFEIKSLQLTDFIQSVNSQSKNHQDAYFAFADLPLYRSTHSGVHNLYCINTAKLRPWLKHRNTNAIGFLEFGDTVSTVELKLIENGFLLGQRKPHDFQLKNQVLFGGNNFRAKQNCYAILTNGSRIYSDLSCQAIGVMFDVPVIVDLRFSSYFPDYENEDSRPEVFLTQLKIDFCPEGLLSSISHLVYKTQPNYSNTLGLITSFYEKSSRGLRDQKRIAIRSNLEKFMTQAGFINRIPIKMWERPNKFSRGQMDSLTCEVAPRNPTFNFLKDNVHAYFEENRNILNISDEAGLMLNEVALDYFEWMNCVLDDSDATSQIKKNPFSSK